MSSLIYFFLAYFKGIVHQKKESYVIVYFVSFNSCVLYFFCIALSFCTASGVQCCLDPNILQNIFCVPQNKEMHLGLSGKCDIINFFGLTIPLKFKRCCYLRKLLKMRFLLCYIVFQKAHVYDSFLNYVKKKLLRSIRILAAQTEATMRTNGQHIPRPVVTRYW